MNCKQGDLAIIVKSYAGNEGKVVRCVEAVGMELWDMPDGTSELAFTWRMDRALRSFTGRLHDLVRDEHLRPIRPDEGDDETLSWAGKPEKVAA